MDLNNPPPDGANTAESALPHCGTPKIMVNGLSISSDWFGITMDEFAGRWLPIYTGRPVVDATGLPGRYDFHLEFLNTLGGSTLVNGQASPSPTGESDGKDQAPTLAVALRHQLGLILSPAKAPLPVIVVDRVDRPSEN